MSDFPALPEGAGFMSRVTIALGSLIVGAILGFFWGNHTSSLVQLASAQSTTFANAGPIPQIPGIKMHLSKSNLSNMNQQLDGVDFKDSTFKGITWEYSGGAFDFTNVTFSTPMRVKFEGAAANAIAMLALMQSIDSGAKPPPHNPNAPVLWSTSAEKQTVRMDFASPYK